MKKQSKTLIKIFENFNLEFLFLMYTIKASKKHDGTHEPNVQFAKFAFFTNIGVRASVRVAPELSAMMFFINLIQIMMTVTVSEGKLTLLWKLSMGCVAVGLNEQHLFVLLAMKFCIQFFNHGHIEKW